MTEHMMDILGELPLEIAEMVFEYLRAEDLVNCSRVSIRWAQQVSHDRVWSRHMLYHKYVKKYWEDGVGGSYEQGSLMKKYFIESRIKNNIKKGDYNTITSVPSGSKYIVTKIGYRQVWQTGGGLLLSNGDLLTFKDPPDIDLRRVDMTLSSDLRLLAVPYKNFLYIYERNVEFELLSLLATCPPTEEEPDGSEMLSLMSCPKVDKESVASFMSKYESEEGPGLYCHFFTGVDSPTERRACLLIHSFRGSTYYLSYALWDVDRNRLVHRWRFQPHRMVMEGWDGRGVCIAHDMYHNTDNRIEFYDVDMRPLTVIPMNGYGVVTLVLRYNFSVGIIPTFESKRQVVMWEKGLTEYRVLVDNIRGGIVCVTPSTVAYCLDYETVAIIAAPDWKVVAHVKTKFMNDFYLTEYSDGSLFVIMRTTQGCIWHNIDRRNTSEISEWPINSGHEFKLPERSRIVFNSGAKLVYTMDERMSIIDYNK